MSDPRKPLSNSRDGWGILNPQGNLWTPEIFDTKEQARSYFVRFWTGVKSAPDWSQYGLTWCRQRTAPVREPKQVRP
ncbi:hypothetical protein [Mesorhizobium sp. B263B2A]|uniref:hypothetical protein n=1 Tax=Mesorhizobium sp. B263B2A TaxID=2876669 RepID=UPI001CD06668|nr:hypothetical protein [Mesorhizobium sp. B263B2A]MCA0032699.1 hypothetical protein [Mesorhizobium sp. B263B2A]